MVGDVVARILYDNFLQAQILGQEQAGSGARTEAYEDLMVELEADGLLNRRIELLPTTEDMTERARAGAGMTSPELAVLLAYAKRDLRSYVLDSDLPDDPVFDPKLARYFPDVVVAAVRRPHRTAPAAPGAGRHHPRQRGAQLPGDHLRVTADGRCRNPARAGGARL